MSQTYLIVELLAFIRDGGDLEMPAGLAKRLVANGWRLPDKTPEESKEAFLATLTDIVSTVDYDVDPAAAVALVALGITH